MTYAVRQRYCHGVPQPGWQVVKKGHPVDTVICSADSEAVADEVADALNLAETLKHRSAA